MMSPNKTSKKRNRGHIQLQALDRQQQQIKDNVHPVPPPNSEIKERIRKIYESNRIKIEKLLTLGYTTSGDP